ncbi:RICIN domain-containing protein [Nonomuraea purpurea]|uniref:RICIN domain-containing protein n=1 Tax=Nonomuraea purpurea TaxID=1849276 RepID=A0ABV8GTV1_9ACTN
MVGFAADSARLPRPDLWFGKDIYMVQAGCVYVLVNVNTGTCLDENLGNNWVRAWGRNGGDNQKWVLDREGPGRRWTLQNVASGRFLCPESGDLGSALRTDDDLYLWRITDDEHGDRLCLPQGPSQVVSKREDDSYVWHFEEA